MRGHPLGAHVESAHAVDRGNPYRTGTLRGVVRTIDGDEAKAIVDGISRRYTGRPFPYPSSTVFVLAADRSRLVSLADAFEDTPAT